MVITHDEYTFFANNSVWKAWIWKGDTFLRPKSRSQGIMTSEFIFPFSQLNLASFSPRKRQEIVQETWLIETEAVEVFEYEKNNDEYWDGAKLHQQVVKKALPIAETLYLDYSVLFLFDNATSHSVYAKNALQARDMNKGSEGKQPILRNGWFDQDGIWIIHPMNFQ